jgi:hypothetical protein
MLVLIFMVGVAAMVRHTEGGSTRCAEVLTACYSDPTLEECIGTKMAENKVLCLCLFECVGRACSGELAELCGHPINAMEASASPADTTGIIAAVLGLTTAASRAWFNTVHRSGWQHWHGGITGGARDVGAQQGPPDQLDPLFDGRFLHRKAVEFDAMMAVLVELKPPAALEHAVYLFPEHHKFSSMSRRLHSEKQSRMDGHNNHTAAGAAVHKWMAEEHGRHQLAGLMLRLEHLPGPSCPGGTHRDNALAQAAG